MPRRTSLKGNCLVLLTRNESYTLKRKQLLTALQARAPQQKLDQEESREQLLTHPGDLKTSHCTNLSLVACEGDSAKHAGGNNVVEVPVVTVNPRTTCTYKYTARHTAWSFFPISFKGAGLLEVV